MTSHFRVSAFVVATALVVALFAPNASAAAPPSKDKVAKARELTALQASDTQLADAIKTLDAQVKATDASTQSARQSVKAAQTAEDLANARLRLAESAMTRLRGALVARAIEAYKRPANFVASGFASNMTVSELSRRKALLDHVTNAGEDALDQLHSTRQDLTRQRSAAARAHTLAVARQKVVEAKLVALLHDRATKSRLNAALDKRIAEVQAEVVAISGDSNRVSDILRANGSTSSATVTGKSSRFGVMWPLKGRLTSGFGRRWGRLHAGIDIAAPKGTPIHAAKAGTVVFAGQMRGYGNVVVIDHGGGLSTLYGHQSRLGSRRGQHVDQGQVIGYVGSTGHSTGNHCHFETRINGTPQNPRNYLP